MIDDRVWEKQVGCLGPSCELHHSANSFAESEEKTSRLVEFK